MNFQSLLNYLNELKNNNNREWFQKNKNRYDGIRKEFMSFVDILIKKIHKIDPEIGLQESKDCIFRIYRDVRFSKDKSPYKTNFGAYVAKGGRKSIYAGYYFHVEPGESFASGGIYMPSNAVLKMIRTDIYENTDEFKSIIEDKSFKEYFQGLWDSKLKKVPNGFPSDFPDGELLKYKDYVIIRTLSEKQLISDGLLEILIDIYKKMLPFNKFMNNAISAE